MTEKIIIYLKRFPITLFLILLITGLSLFTPPKIEIEPIRFADKWTHILMYCLSEVSCWIEYSHCYKKKMTHSAILLLWLLPIFYGGSMELAQAYCTTERSGDWLDFLSNIIGCNIGFILGRLYFLHKQ